MLALVYAGFKPVLKEFGFPPVDESQVGGALLAPEEEGEIITEESLAAHRACENAGADDEQCADGKP